jgi:hypothetical protein
MMNRAILATPVQERIEVMDLGNMVKISGKFL